MKAFPPHRAALNRLHPRLLLLGSIAAVVSACSAADAPAQTHPSAAEKAARGFRPPAHSLGLNVSILAPIYQEIPFVDAFKESEPWVFQKMGAPYGTPVSGLSSVDEQGWVKTLAPGERAKACVFQDATGHFPGGTYTLGYDGQGALTVTGPVRIVESRRGEMRVAVTPAPGVRGPCIVETGTVESDPIRNIRFIMPGFENTYQTQPFYPPFVNEFRPFHVVRLLDWSRVNRSEVVEWSDRRPPGYATQAKSLTASSPAVTQNDVALEYQIDFANQAGVNPWFLTPIKASDDYIRHMARLVRQRLRPDLHPMIELSNEVWNGRFTQYQYARDMGQRLNLDPDSPPEKTLAGLYWYALRAGQMFDIWNEVYGPDAHRITHVLSGQQNWARESEIILSYGDTYKKVDVLAVGGYLSAFDFYKITDPRMLNDIAGQSVDQVIHKMTENFSRLDSQWASQKAIADKYGVDLVVYEGGFDFDTSRVPAPYKKPITELLIAVGRDPRMGDLYRDLLRRETAAGITLFTHFDDVGQPGAYGSFGALEYQDQPPATSPKYQALMVYLAAHPVRWAP